MESHHISPVSVILPSHFSSWCACTGEHYVHIHPCTCMYMSNFRRRGTCRLQYTGAYHVTKSPRVSLRFSFGRVKGHTWSYCAERGRAWERGYSMLLSNHCGHYSQKSLYITHIPGCKGSRNCVKLRVITRK